MTKHFAEGPINALMELVTRHEAKTGKRLDYEKFLPKKERVHRSRSLQRDW